MTDSERAALRQIQDENFQLRAELHHERTCIDGAVQILSDQFVQLASRPNATLLDGARLVEEALKQLKQRYSPKD